MRFGMHLSFSGGPEHAKALGCQALQIFCGNPRGWQKSPLDPQFVKNYRQALDSLNIHPLVVHATYLINLAAPDEKIYKLSCDGFILELERAAQLGAQFYVIHIGNHKGSGVAEGRRRVAACVQAAVKAVPKGPEILFENTAGGGSTLGGTFEDVAGVIAEARTERLGMCLDTCHTLAAGYDIRTPAGVKEMLDCVERTVGLKRLRCLHINDSKGELGSHLDRHEHIGDGQIGRAGFRAFFADRRVWDLPAILETPRESPAEELDDLWRAIDIAIKAGALKQKDAGRKPAAESLTKESMRPRTPKSKQPPAGKPAPRRSKK